MPELEVVAVTVTYGSREDLVLQTLSTALAAGVTSAVCVLNGVGRTKAAVIKAEAKTRFGERVHFLILERNEGSAGGFAAGLECAMASGAQNMWLLDDDSVVDPMALKALLSAKAACSLQTVAFASFRPADPQQQSLVMNDGLGGWYPRRGSFMYFDLFDHLFRRRSGHNYVPQERWSIPYGPYGGLLLSRTIVDKIGFPDRALVLYEDDTEYTARIAEAGITLMLCQQSVVIDADGKWAGLTGTKSGPSRLVSSDSRTRRYYAVRNRTLFDRDQAKLGRSSKRLFLNVFVYLTITLLLATKNGRLVDGFRICAAAFDGWRNSPHRGASHRVPLINTADVI